AIASKALWTGLVWRPRPARVRQLRYPVSIPLAVSGWAGDGAGRFAVVRVRSADPRWLSDLWPLDWSACLPWCLSACPGGAPWHAPGAGLWKGYCATRWLFCWLLGGVTIFEKPYLTVGTAGFEPATPCPTGMHSRSRGLNKHPSAQVRPCTGERAEADQSAREQNALPFALPSLNTANSDRCPFWQATPTCLRPRLGRARSVCATSHG